MDHITWQLLVPVAFLSVVFFLNIIRNIKTHHNEPHRYPYWVPWLGSTISFLIDSNALIERALSYFRSSRPFSLLVGGETLYILTDPCDVKAMFKHPKQLAFDPFIELVLKGVYGVSPDDLTEILKRRGDLYGGQSVLEKTHQFYRDYLLPGPQYDLMVQRYVQQVNGYLEIGIGNGAEVDLYDWVRKTVASLATSAIFGKHLLEGSPKVLEALWKFDEKFILMVYGVPKFMIRDAYQSREYLVDALYEYFSKEIPEEDKVGMIWNRKARLEEAQLSPDGIARLTFTIFWALHTNSVRVSFWMLFYILATPGLKAQIREEVGPAFNGQNPQLQNVKYLLEQCPILVSTYNEVLRITSGSASSRVVLEDVVVEGYLYRKGGKVIAPSIQPHMSIGFWGEDASDFRFERFLDPEAEKQTGSTFRPFGGGQTHCPGRFFARVEILSLIASIIHSCDIQFVDKSDPSARINRKKPAIGILDPEPGFAPRVKLQPRENFSNS